jgi:hypothetical protein
MSPLAAGLITSILPAAPWRIPYVMFDARNEFQHLHVAATVLLTSESRASPYSRYDADEVKRSSKADLIA